jgi:hypothetical protein
VQPLSPIGYHILNKHTWLAKNLRSDFASHFRHIEAPEIEGLVLKDPTDMLTLTTATASVKVRKPHKNYSF